MMKPYSSERSTIHVGEQHSLSIWVITDNKVGHRNQLEGFISALSYYRAVTITWISVSNRLQGIVDLIMRRQQVIETNQPSLLLGAGHQTHIQLLTFKRYFKKPAIVLMKPSFPLSWFDLCFIPRHDKMRGISNVIETFGAINRIQPSTNHDGDKGLILLGGISKHFVWKTEVVIRQIKQIIQKYPQIVWKIASSRRTPDACLIALHSNFSAQDIIEPDSVNGEWLPQQMQIAGHIWATEDSVSMVYEAITSGARVSIVRLIRAKKNRVTREMDQLLKERRVGTLNSSLNEKLPLINEAKRCAKIALERLGL